MDRRIIIIITLIGIMSIPLIVEAQQVQDDLSQLEIEFMGISEYELKTKTVLAVMNYEVNNPTDREIVIDRINYEIFSEDVRIANGTIESVVIPARQSKTISSIVEIESGFIMNLLLKGFEDAFTPKQLTASIIIHDSRQDIVIDALPMIGSKVEKVIGGNNPNLVNIGFKCEIFLCNHIDFAVPKPIEGKIAIIERKQDETAFFWEYSKLSEEGVKGAIVYNNKPGMFEGVIYKSLGIAELPIVVISQRDGQMLLENFQNKKVSMIVEEVKPESDELDLVIKGEVIKEFLIIEISVPFERPIDLEI